MSAKIPSLSDLYRLSAQLELDQELPVQSLRERDHAIGLECDDKHPAADEPARLLFWLEQVAGPASQTESWWHEGSAAHLARVVSAVFGFVGMSSFLLTSSHSLVNVFTFLALFVFAQLLLCMIATVVMARTLAGSQPTVMPLNPARLVVARLLPDRRHLREAQSVLRLVFLRYGQELGAVFTLGAIAAFFVVLGLREFSFVWGSTFTISNDLVERLTSLFALPWASWLSVATVDATVIADSRYHAAITDLAAANRESMRGWWPFLIMSMCCYALLPRLLLWLISRWSYRQRIRSAVSSLRGSALVLARMRAPLVRTQGETTGPVSLAPQSVDHPSDERLLLLNWSNALAPADAGQFEVLFAVPPANIVNAGMGSLAQESKLVSSRLQAPVEQLYVAVKSWEPPMADLSDFLAGLGPIRRCTVLLVPLAGRSITVAKLEDWRRFTRALDIELVEVLPLERL